jgi:glycosyltransferase involved in cell wall biosynthesis
MVEGFRFDPRVVPQLRRLVERLRPDVIETHHVKSHLIVRLSGVWKKRPWIAFHHGYTDTDFRSPIYNSLDRWSLPAAARIVTMNRVFRQQLAARGAPEDRMTVLHNAVQAPPGCRAGVDAAALARKKTDLGMSPDEKIILCVGRLSREKAQIDLVAALQQLRQMRPSRAVRLIMVGDGPERSRIAQAGESAGLGSSVVFAGQRGDVRPYYEAADVLAIPSLSEGSPNVLLEAMAFGIPVVATWVGGIPEIVTHGETALLVPPRSPQAMAEAIDVLLSNPGTAVSLAEKARRRVERDYSPQARANSLIEIYNQLYRSAHKPSPGDESASG